MRVSTELVASSRIRIGGSARNARAIVSSCFSPGRQVGRVVVDDRVVAVGQRPDEVVDVGGLGGRARSPPRSRPRGRRRCSRGSCRGTATCPGGPSRTCGAGRRAVSSRVSIAVDRDPAAVDLVEAHQQVDERRLAGAGRADDGDRLARLRRRGSGPRSAACPARSGTTRPRTRPRPATPAERRRGATGSAISSASSSSSKTRSAEATADWRTLAMLAVWMIGKVNWREYWMNATDVAEASSGRSRPAGRR